MFKVCKLSDIPEATDWQQRMKGLKSRPRVFETYLHNLREGEFGDRRLVTTVKDLHLAFGRMSKLEQTMLAEYLDALLERNKTSQLVVAFDDRDDRALVTRACADGVICYTISPA